MAAIIWTDVTAFEAKLATVPGPAQDAMLAYVNDALNVCNFGGEDSPKLRLARIYFAAHFGMMMLRGANVVGPLQSSTAGKLTRSYAVIQSVTSSKLYGATSWGQLYEALLRTTPARIGTVA